MKWKFQVSVIWSFLEWNTRAFYWSRYWPFQLYDEIKYKTENFHPGWTYLKTTYHLCDREVKIQSHGSCSKAIHYNGHCIYLWTTLEQIQKQMSHFCSVCAEIGMSGTECGWTAHFLPWNGWLKSTLISHWTPNIIFQLNSFGKRLFTSKTNL